MRPATTIFATRTSLESISAMVGQACMAFAHEQPNTAASNRRNAGPDVTPVFHPAATRDRGVLSRISAGEATGGARLLNRLRGAALRFGLRKIGRAWCREGVCQ